MIFRCYWHRKKWFRVSPVGFQAKNDHQRSCRAPEPAWSYWTAITGFQYFEQIFRFSAGRSTNLTLLDWFYLFLQTTKCPNNVLCCVHDLNRRNTDPKPSKMWSSVFSAPLANGHVTSRPGSDFSKIWLLSKLRTVALWILRFLDCFTYFPSS